jgi:hypothetical protein
VANGIKKTEAIEHLLNCAALDAEPTHTEILAATREAVAIAVQFFQDISHIARCHVEG